MREFLPEVDAWRARGDRVAIATVVKVERFGAATGWRDDGRVEHGRPCRLGIRWLCRNGCL